MKNPWQEIELSDYEGHMSFKTVGQLQSLNAMMKAQFESYPSERIMILGAAGGNGIEHINTAVTKKVYAVDINPRYLACCQARYPDLNGILETVCADLADKDISLPKCDLITADLLIEYIGIGCFSRVIQKTDPVHISCITQSDGENQGFVSDSPYSRAFDGLDGIHRQIGAEELNKAMAEIGYRAIRTSEQVLLSGKRLVMSDYAAADIRKVGKREFK